MFTGLRDNFLVARFVRSRLRPRQVIPVFGFCLIVYLIVTAGTALIVSGSAALSFRNLSHFWNVKTGRGMFNMLLFAQFIILYVVGSNQVIATVVEDRRRGVMDFHRITPQSSLALVAGYVLGGPLREYLLFTMSLPFTVLAVVMGKIPALTALSFYLVFFMGAVFFNLCALLAGLVVKKNRYVVGIILILMVVSFMLVPMFIKTEFSLLLHLTPLLSFAHLLFTTFSLEQAAEALIKINFTTVGFYSLQVPVALFNGGILALACTFMVVALCRKLHHEPAPAFSRTQIAGLFLTVVLLALGNAWTRLGDIGLQRFITMMLMEGFLFFFVLLAETITPPALAYCKAVQRARRRGRSYLRPWCDEASNISVTIVLVAVIAVFCSLLMMRIGLQWSSDNDTLIFREIASAFLLVVFAMVAYASLKEFTEFTWPGSERNYFALFLFIIWVLPLVAGLIFGRALGGNIGAYGASACPLIGVFNALYAEARRKSLMAGGINHVLFSLLYNAAMAVVFSILAWVKRHRVWSRDALDPFFR